MYLLYYIDNIMDYLNLFGKSECRDINAIDIFDIEGICSILAIRYFSVLTISNHSNGKTKFSNFSTLAICPIFCKAMLI